MRRVLLIVHASAVGGMEVFCVDLAREYAFRGIDVTMVLPPARTLDVLDDHLVAAGARVVRLWTHDPGGAEMPRGPWRAKGRGLVGLVGVIRRLRPDVVHLHTSLGGLSAAAVCRAASRAALVVTEHVPPETPRTRAQRLRCWLLDRLAGAMVGVSRRNLDLRERHLGARRAVCAVVPNGVPTSSGELRTRWREATRAELGYRERDVVVGVAVRLVRDKCTDDILHAFARLPCRERLCLLVVGDGPERAALEALAARLGIADRTTFAGFRRHPKPLIAAMDLFVLAVPVGSMSIALLEAMDLEVASVITFCGPGEAVIDGETGLCAPARDRGGLSDRLRRLVNDDALRLRLGREGARHVRARFSIGRAADDYLAIYGAARSGARPPSRLRL